MYEESMENSCHHFLPFPLQQPLLVQQSPSSSMEGAKVIWKINNQLSRANAPNHVDDREHFTLRGLIIDRGQAPRGKLICSVQFHLVERREHFRGNSRVFWVSQFLFPRVKEPKVYTTQAFELLSWVTFLVETVAMLTTARQIDFDWFTSMRRIFVFNHVKIDFVYPYCLFVTVIVNTKRQINVTRRRHFF